MIDETGKILLIIFFIAVQLKLVIGAFEAINDAKYGNIFLKQNDRL